MHPLQPSVLALLPGENLQVAYVPLYCSKLGPVTGFLPCPVTLAVDFQVLPHFCSAARCSPHLHGDSDSFTLSHQQRVETWPLAVPWAAAAPGKDVALPGMGLPGCPRPPPPAAAVRGHRPGAAAAGARGSEAAGLWPGGAVALLAQPLASQRCSSSRLPVDEEQGPVGFALSPVCRCDGSPGR